MSERVVCELCGSVVPPHGHYVVRIDVYADPSVPPLQTEDLEELDVEQTFTDLLAQMQHMTAEELQDDVHWRFEYKVCRACHRQVLANPLGKPRRRRSGEN